MRPPLASPLLAVLCLAAAVRTQVADPTALQDLGPELRDVLVDHDVPALGAARIEDGQLVAIGAAGVRARGHETPVSVDDLWHLGSCTKAMTASLCARLVAARDDLDWSGELAGAFPELEVHEDLAGVTLPMLLSHRAGLAANPLMIWGELRNHPGPMTDARELIARTVLTRRPAFDPGTRFLYSNTGYMVAGAWLESVTGQSWEALMQAEVFGPLSMESAGFGPPGAAGFDPEAAPTQPWAHRDDGTPVAPGPEADNPPALGPAGTVHCTLADWAAFVITHLDAAADGNRAEPWLTDAQRGFLHTPPDDLADYAMGWGRIAAGDGPTRLQHAGSNTMWFCIAQVVPGERRALLVTCNQGGDAAQAACQAALAALGGR